MVLAAGCLQRLVEGTAKPFSVIGLRGCGEEHAVTRRAHDHASPFERTSRQQLEAAHVHSPLARRCRWLASPWSPRRPRRPAACGNVSAIYPPSSLAPAPPALLPTLSLQRTPPRGRGQWHPQRCGTAVVVVHFLVGGSGCFSASTRRSWTALGMNIRLSTTFSCCWPLLRVGGKFAGGRERGLWGFRGGGD